METVTPKHNEIMKCVERLESYNTLCDIDNLFCIMNDLMDKCTGELSKEYYNDAKNTLDKIHTMFWVIRDKFPKTLYEDIEQVTFWIEQQNKN